MVLNFENLKIVLDYIIIIEINHKYLNKFMSNNLFQISKIVLGEDLELIF